MTIQNFEELRIFQIARDINADIWRLTKRPKVAEDNGLVWQMLNSSGSMMDNIAEGFGRGSNNEFKTFLGYSNGSASELKSQLTRLVDRNCISQGEFDRITSKLDSFGKQTTSLISVLKKSPFRGSRLK